MKQTHSALQLGQRTTLSDVGATACSFFSAEQPENGQPIDCLLNQF
ncbi:hypothetical protein JCM19238_3698 [Vibrio ponticus]|nr:hypothetical protein JCM19238_3698 [Vibrio ponticus]